MRRTIGLLLATSLLGALGLTAAPAVAAPASAAAKHTYYAFLSPAGATVTPGAGYASRDGVVLTGDGHADVTGTTTAPTTRLGLSLSVTQCLGAPRVEVAVDGVTYLSRRVYGVARYALVGHWAAGPHTVRIRMHDQYHSASCVRRISTPGPELYGYDDGSTYVLPVWQAGQVQNAIVSPRGTYVSHLGDEAYVSTDATLTIRQDTEGARSLQVNAYSVPCEGSPVPQVDIRLDGVSLYAGPAGGEHDWAHIFAVTLPNGPHDVSVTVSGLTQPDGCTNEVRLSGFYFSGYA